MNPTERPARPSSRTRAPVERTVARKLRWKLFQRDAETKAVTVIADGVGAFFKPSEMPRATVGVVFQAFSSDDGETWERGIDFHWNGHALLPLPCRKRPGGVVCWGASGHKGPCG